MSNLVIGYHGFGNFGDDVLLETYLSHTGQECIVLTKEYSNSIDIRHTQIVFKNFFKEYNNLLRSVEKIIWVGGTCFYGGIRQQTFLFRCVLNARLKGCDFVFYSVGVDGFSSIPAKILAILAMRLSTRVYFRDQVSFQSFKSYASKALPYLDIFLLQDRFSIEIRRSQILVNLSSEFSSEEEIKALIDKFYPRYERIVFVCLNGSSRGELEILDMLRNHKHLGFVDTYIHMNTQATRKLFCQSSAYVGYRLHGLAMAAMCDLEVSSLVYQAKIRKFCQELGVDPRCLVNSVGDLNPIKLNRVEVNNHDFIQE